MFVCFFIFVESLLIIYADIHFLLLNLDFGKSIIEGNDIWFTCPAYWLTVLVNITVALSLCNTKGQTSEFTIEGGGGRGFHNRPSLLLLLLAFRSVTILRRKLV